MTLNRSVAPKYNSIDNIKLIKATEEKLKNGIPLYTINTGSQDLIRIEFVFSAGAWYQKNPLEAYATNQMLDEGTKTSNASELADKLDYYGAFLETDPGADSSSVVLYTLNKHLESTLPIVEDIIKNPIFPEKEFLTFVENKKQKLLVDNQKVNHSSRKKFSELLFGAKHPYGYYVQATDYDNLKTTHLANFHKHHYSSDNCKIIVAGKISDKTIHIIRKYFEGNDWGGKMVGGESTSEKKITTTSNLKNIIEKEDAIQSAIRVGRPLFNKTHPDYLPMQVLNTVLGGYFGSRLMANIREDKGYTYGIGSSVASLKNGGYFVIASEVGVDVCSKALDEIFFEIKRLREEPVSDSELQLVKNYMLGGFLKSIDGAFALAERFKSIMEYGLDYTYYDRYIQTIKNISTNELMVLANKYLQENSLIELVVGKKG